MARHEQEQALALHSGLVLSERQSSRSPSGEFNVAAPPAGLGRLRVAALLVVVCWLAFSLAIASLLIQRSQNQLLTQLHAHGSSEANHLAHALEQDFEKAEQLAATLALQGSIKMAVNVLNQTAQSRLARPLAERIEFLAAHPVALEPADYLTRLSEALDIKIMFILDRAGSCVITNRNASPCLGVNYRERDYFQQALAAGQAMQFAVGKTVPEPSFFFSNAIIDNGEFVGAAVVRFYSEELGWVLGRSDGISLLISPRGLVVAAPENDMILARVDATVVPLGRDGSGEVATSEPARSDLPLQRQDDDYYQHPIWWFEQRPYLLFTSELGSRNLSALRLVDISRVFEARRDLWVLASLLIVIGCLLIIFIERSLRYAALRKAHLKMLSEANSQLSVTAQKLYELATSDSLTGLKNHRYFMQCLQEQVEACRQHQRPLALISMDIDHFKRINDTYGHPVGDEVIVRLANASLALVRGEDIVGRLGGEEFAILLPGLNSEGARVIAERIRAWCEGHSIEVGGNTIGFTVSLGVAALRPDTDIKQLLARLDEALYRAKHGGRNQVVLADW